MELRLYDKVIYKNQETNEEETGVICLIAEVSKLCSNGRKKWLEYSIATKTGTQVFLENDLKLIKEN